MRDLNLSGWRGAGLAAHRLPIISAAVLLLFVLSWLLPGLVGHHPWKPDEGYTFGLVEHIAATGDWVVPQLAGEPFMEKPPIFFITAAWFLRAFGGWLPVYDAARLASGMWLALAMCGIGLGARHIFGARAGRWAVFALLGCIGLPLRAHQMITDTALFAGIAWGIYGMQLALLRPVLGGIVLGLAGGVTLLSKGLLGPGVLGLTALLLPALSPGYRTKGYAGALLIALVVGCPLPGLWMWNLYTRSPELFEIWFRINNFGRFNGTAHLGPTASHFFYVKTLPWYAFPALPLALLGLWRAWRGDIHPQPERITPVLLCLVILYSVLALAADARELYAMPLLAPIAMLAVGALVEYPAAARRWLVGSRVVLVLAVLLISVVLVGGYALATGHPAALGNWFTHKRFIGWQPGWHWQGWLAFALLLSIAVSLWKRVEPGVPCGFVWRWALFIVMLWGGLATLWLPALDYSMRYRDVFLQLQPKLAELQQKNECVASIWFGEPQRALLDYYDHYRTLRLETSAKGWSCKWLLVQSENGRLPDVVIQRGLLPLVTAQRPGDVRDRFMLFALPDSVRAVWPDDDMRRGVLGAGGR